MSIVEIYGVIFYLSFGVIPMSFLETRLIEKKGEVKNWRDMIVHLGFIITFACGLVSATLLLAAAVVKYLTGFPVWYSNEFGLLFCAAVIALGQLFFCFWPLWTMYRVRHNEAKASADSKPVKGMIN